MRKERDTLGEVEVPDEKYYGAQTQRSKENFPFGQKIPLEIIYAFAYIKKAAAIVNGENELIVKAADAILEGKLDDNFPLSVWQTGSGTQTNMNVNEVIANYVSELAGKPLGSHDPVHPNDNVNKSQSSNDTFPSAMHIAATIKIRRMLLPALEMFHDELKKKSEAFSEIVKVGRTHLMDATPLTLGQEFSGYASQVKHGIEAITNALVHLQELALGATAVGTGINAPKDFGLKVCEKLSELTGIEFVSAPNKFEALASSDSVVEMSGALKRLAASFMKIANDIRWMASGPRAGLGELSLPANEPGSSIMPGKVNPTQCESMTMVAAHVMGNDTSISLAGSQGNFELNVYRPMMAYNLLESISLLGHSATNFTKKCLEGLEANLPAIEEHLSRSLMSATALAPVIGYEKTAHIVKKAFHENITLKEAAREYISEDEFDKIVDPKKMI